MNKIIKIISRHRTCAEAVKAAGLTRPSYERALEDAVRLADTPAPHRDLKACTLAFVVEPFSNAARIYGDRAEVIVVTECDIKLLNRIDIGGCLDDIGFQLAKDCGTHLEIGGAGLIPDDKRVKKSREGRAWIAQAQVHFPNVYASGLSYCG